MSEIELAPTFRVAFLTLLFIILFNRFVSMVFVLNFTTQGVNFTMGFAILVLSAISIWIYGKCDFCKNHFRSLWFLTIGLTGIASIPNAMISALSAALALQIVGILITETFDIASPETKWGLGLAPLANYLIYLILGQTYLFGTIEGYVLLFSLFIFGLVLGRSVERQENTELESIIRTYPYMTLLLLVLGIPSFVVTWSIDRGIIGASRLSLDVFVALTTLSMTTGILLALNQDWNQESAKWFLIYAIGSLLSFIDILFIGTVPFLSAGVATFSVLASIYSAPTRPGQGSSSMLFAVQLLSLLFVVLYVVAGNWAFVPSIFGVMSHGLAGVHLFLVLMLHIGVNGYYWRLTS